jgi:hypothetical protein
VYPNSGCASVKSRTPGKRKTGLKTRFLQEFGGRLDYRGRLGRERRKVAKPAIFERRRNPVALMAGRPGSLVASKRRAISRKRLRQVSRDGLRVFM